MTRSTSGFPEIFQEMILREKGPLQCKDSTITGCFDVCKITNPDKIRSLLVEILLEMIDALAVFIMFVRMKRLLGRHLWQLKRFHQAVHSSDADVNAIITPKNMGDFICSKPFVIVGIDVKNLGSNHLIFFGSVSWC